MIRQGRQEKIDRPVWLLILAVLLLSPPFLQIWFSAEAPWYTIFLVWGGVIVLAALLQWRRPTG